MPDYSFSERQRLAEGALPPLRKAVEARVRRQVAMAFFNFFRGNECYWSGGQGDEAAAGALRSLSVKHGEDFGHFLEADLFKRYMLHPQLPTDRFLDCVELGLLAAARLALFDSLVARPAAAETWKSLKDAVNQAFALGGAAYAAVDLGTIVPKDSDLLHEEVVEPALALTRKPGFESTNECFTKALDCLRRGDTKDACTNARRALESALKTIADRQGGWLDSKGRPLSDKAQLKDLIQAALGSRLLPSSWEATFNGFRPFLESTVPSVTNPPSHGSAAPMIVPEEIAEFAIASVAACLVLFIKRSEAT